MLRRIYKYRVYVGSSLTVRGLTKVVLFGPQDADGLFVWAEVLEGGTAVTLDVLPTGAEVPFHSKHWASCQDGQYVWHLYERADR